MKVVICWPNFSGYIAACWRALLAHRDIDFTVICQESTGPTIGFDAALMSGLPVRVLPAAQWNDAALVRDMVVENNPDVIVIPGWFHRPYTRLARDGALSHVKFVMMMDTPRRDTLRQRLGRYKVAWLLRRVSRVIVAGERAWQLARVLGVAEQKIRRGCYGFDEPLFGAVCAARPSNPRDWPRSFLFVGRYIPEKGIDLLLDAYARYRGAPRAAGGGDPWSLTCCGKGPLADLIAGAARGGGVCDRGFISPPEQPATFARHGTFVLPSRYEPWGVALAEALATGLPAICSEACGASVDLLRPYYNGLLVPTGDAKALADAMRWIEAHQEMLPEMGRRGAQLAAAFAADVWAVRWAEMFRELAPAAPSPSKPPTAAPFHASEVASGFVAPR